MTTQILNPKTLLNSVQYGFSQIAVVSGGKTVFMSGQVGWDENQQLGLTFKLLEPLYCDHHKKR